MAEVLWSEQAAHLRDLLPASIRDGVMRRLEYLQQMPRMYPIAYDSRFPGCRSFWVEPTYRVFYMVAAGGDDVYVVAVVEEEVEFPVEWEALNSG